MIGGAGCIWCIFGSHMGTYRCGVRPWWKVGLWGVRCAQKVALVGTSEHGIPQDQWSVFGANQRTRKRHFACAGRAYQYSVQLTLSPCSGPLKEVECGSACPAARGSRESIRRCRRSIIGCDTSPASLMLFTVAHEDLCFDRVLPKRAATKHRETRWEERV